MRGMPNDVFFKVGLITVIGLSAKNAILIIEFAKDLVAQGKGVIEATLQAVHLRFRPILMTSIAFILGVLPLVVSSGAGSASQRAIGTGVMGGMITATVLAIFFVPVFFVVVRRIFKARVMMTAGTPPDAGPRRGARRWPGMPAMRSAVLTARAALAVATLRARGVLVADPAVRAAGRAGAADLSGRRHAGEPRPAPRPPPTSTGSASSPTRA